MGILPLQFVNEENADKLNLKGDEIFTISISDEFKMGDLVTITTNTGVNFQAKVRLDTAPEIEYYKNNGILLYVLRKIISVA
jgi:aconitate hydratase